MLFNKLVSELNSYYQIGQQRRECNAMVQCFGIKNGKLMSDNNIKPEDVVEASLLKGTKYATEIRKGMKLAKYVELKAEMPLNSQLN